MTNLLEKSLIVGFSVFSLISLLGFITPYIDELSKYNEGDSNLNQVILFMEEIDYAINYVIENNAHSYLNDIYYPENLNFSTFDFFIKFEYILEGKIDTRIIEYEFKFWPRSYEKFNPGVYKIQVVFQDSMIDIRIA